MNNKKSIIIIIFIITLSTFIFPNNNKYFNEIKVRNFNFNKNFIGFINLKSFLIYSNINTCISMNNLIYFKESLETIINEKNSVPKIEPDYIIIYTFINSLYYLIKFKINLWRYNQSIFYGRNNKIKPYFHINLKNKIINIGLNVYL